MSKWREYDAARKDAQAMAAGLSPHEQAQAVNATFRGLCDIARQGLTKQGRFEESFLSLDAPAEDGSTLDYSSGNREVNRLTRELDAPIRERLRDRMFAEAIRKLSGHPELQETLRAIRTLEKKEKIISALKIKDETYRKRLSRVTELLKISL